MQLGLLVEWALFYQYILIITFVININGAIISVKAARFESVSHLVSVNDSLIFFL